MPNLTIDRSWTACDSLVYNSLFCTLEWKNEYRWKFSLFLTLFVRNSYKPTLKLWIYGSLARNPSFTASIFFIPTTRLWRKFSVTFAQILKKKKRNKKILQKKERCYERIFNTTTLWVKNGKLSWFWIQGTDLRWKFCFSNVSLWRPLHEARYEIHAGMQFHAYS